MANSLPRNGVSLNLQVVLFIIIRLVMHSCYRMVYPYLSEFGGGLRVDLTTLSRVLTARSIMGMGTVFLAPLADRRGRRFSMLLGLGVFIAGCVLIGAFPSLPAFIVGLMFTTLGNYVFLPAMQAYLGDRVPYEKRGFALGLTELSWSFSYIAGVPLLGLMIAESGWQSPFYVFAGLGLGVMVLLVKALPADAAVNGKTLLMWQSLQQVLTSRACLTALTFSLLLTVSNEVINLVFGIWLGDAFGLQIAALGAASAVVGLSELGGEAATTFFTDRLGKRRAVRLGLILNSLAALALPFLSQLGIGGALAGLALLYMSFEFCLVSYLPLMTEVAPQARATLMSTNVAAFSLGRAVGALIAPGLYSGGILLSAGATLLVNLLALMVLTKVKKSSG
jgi:predicted MFS family arabinose efflux permease